MRHILQPPVTNKTPAPNIFLRISFSKIYVLPLRETWRSIPIRMIQRVVWDWVHRYCGSKWTYCTFRVINECMHHRKTEKLKTKSVPIPLRPSQISCEMSCDWARVFENFTPLPTDSLSNLQKISFFITTHFSIFHQFLLYFSIKPFRILILKLENSHL
jgi:hypothetical protein